MRRLASLFLAACMSVVSAASPEYPAVVPSATLTFPDDHGAHPAYRTEWWYITGWLEDEAGRERGFQVTFFRVRTGIGEDNPSRFSPRQLILAHAAVADPGTGRLLHAERAERAQEPLVGAAVGATHAWIYDWRLQGTATGYRAAIDAKDFAFDLAFAADRPPVLNGKRGFSQKAPDPINASYYYSRPQLEVTGTLRLGDTTHEVRGRAWLDHEWSSELLPDRASGWDWIGINLHDGGALMAFQMRDQDDAALWTAGTRVSPSWQATALRPDQVRFRPQRRWQSPRTGIEYPVEWQIDVDGRRLLLQPLMDDQELDSRRSTGAIYWEGAVRVLEQGAEIGRGYLEMTGYGEKPPL